MSEVLEQAPTFLARLLDELARVELDVKGYVADHVCYRVATAAEYHAIKTQLFDRGELLHEARVGGRPIATFRLYHAIRCRERAVRLVELPSPKHGSPYPTGWEHAEFVVPEGLAALQARHPALPWDTSALAKAHNPELRLAFGGLSAKFHPEPLDVVIARELAT